MMKVSGPNLADRQALLERAALSGLFTSSQRTKAEGILPAEASTAARAAQHLVQAGLLTRFQAERLLAGRTDGFVLGQYVIEDSVGRGAAGRVYRAKHRTMNRRVALKVLSPELTRQIAARQIFHEGVRAAAKLNHPNIVTTYDANEIGDRFYVVLEYVDGPSVQSLVDQRGPLPWYEACEILRQAAVGLQHAHDQNMTHRNLTPGNVLIAKNTKGPGSVVKLTDFGLAGLSPLSRAMPLEQTPLPPAFAINLRYAAPDRFASGTDPRVDLYSLGGIFHLLLSGRPPGVEGAVELPPQVPPAIVEVVRALLARDAASRIPTTAVLLERLNPFAQTGLPTHDDRGAVNFELAAPAVRNDSLTGGYLTGIPEPEASPWADIVAPFYESGPETLGSHPHEGTPISVPALVLSDAKPARQRHAKPPAKTGSSSSMLIVIAISICVLSLCAIAAVLKYAK